MQSVHLRTSFDRQDRFWTPRFFRPIRRTSSLAHHDEASAAARANDHQAIDAAHLSADSPTAEAESLFNQVDKTVDQAAAEITQQILSPEPVATT